MQTILYTTSRLLRSGPTLVLYGLVKNLDRSRFRPVILTLSAEKENSLKPDFEKLGIEIYCLNVSGWKIFVSGAKEYRRLIGKIRPDIIHTNGFRDIVLGAYAAPKQYFKCVTIHSNWEQDYCLKFGAFVGKICTLLQKWAVKKYQRRIACSEMLAGLLNKKYSHIYFDYVNNGVDTDKFYAVKDKTALRRKLHLPQDKKIIIWAGGFNPVKDPLTMARTILKIAENEYFFVFCGARGQLLAVCKELLKDRKDVLFTGYVTNIEEYFRSADLYVATSLSEGFHLTAYEALACGMPVVLTHLGVYNTLKEMNLAKFYTPQDTNALASIIKLFGAENLSCINAVSLDMVQKLFSMQKMAENYMEIYQEQ